MSDVVGSDLAIARLRGFAAIFCVSALVVLGSAVEARSGAPDRGIMWGVNSHPVQGGPSGTISFSEQMTLLKNAGFRSYRMDVYNLDQMGTLAQVLAAARAAGIVLLPNLIPDPDAADDENGNYAAAYAMGRAYASRFKTDIATWELANEGDNWIGMKGDGSDISQYDRAKYARARGMIRGLLDGIHAGDPHAKGIVNGAGWCHWGFQEQLWRDGVRWDITGWHWYSSYGDLEKARGCGNTNILQRFHDTFGKPIWLTEINVDRYGGDKAAMGNWLVSTMAQLDAVAARYDIQAAYIYVLFNPDAAGDYGIVDAASGVPVPTQAYHAVKAYLSKHPSALY